MVGFPSCTISHLQIIGFRLITPASYVFLLAIALWMFMHPNEQFPYGYFGGEIPFFLATLCATTEALFFPYYYFLFNRVNNRKHSLEVPRPNHPHCRHQPRPTDTPTSPNPTPPWRAPSTRRPTRRAGCGWCATASTP